eukprot:jgi/Tetstr1/429990/TSEL_019851.t1
MDPRVFTSRVDLLEWAVEQGCALVDDQRVVRAAMVDGRVRVLQWGVQSRGWDMPKQHHKTTCWAAEAGKLEWARGHGCPWDEGTCSAAAEGGHLELLQWAREQGCPWNAFLSAATARGGHLELLQWAREQGCPWNENTCDAAAWGGHLAVLQWAREQG